MARNIEIKARAVAADAIWKHLLSLAGGHESTFRQVDTFFAVPNGRLKLRTTSGMGESASYALIRYERSNATDPKLSTYQIADVADGPGLGAMLEKSLGVVGKVSKTRSLFLVGERRSRIHLDLVDVLGSFVEIEVPLHEGETVEAGTAIARDLMKELGIRAESLVAGSYLDLLNGVKPS